MNSSQLIEKLNKFYDKLGTNKKYSFLIKGKWGIGKTYTYNEFVENNNITKYYYSLFGISNLRELEKMLLKDNKFPTLNKIETNMETKFIREIIKGFLKDKVKLKNTLEAISINNLIEMSTIRDLRYDSKSLVCLDDFERCDIPMKELMGFVERLKEKVNVVVLCNEEEIKGESKETYEKYKEKVINFNYELSEVVPEVLKLMVASLEVEEEIKENIIKDFETYGNNNIRNMEKLVDLIERLSSSLDDLSEMDKENLLRVSLKVVCNEELSLEELEEKEVNEDIQRYLSVRNYKKGSEREIQQIKELFRKDELLEIEKKLTNLGLCNEVECEKQLKEIENSIRSIKIKKISGVRLARLIINYEKWNIILDRTPGLSDEIYRISDVIIKDFGNPSLFLFYENKDEEEVDRILQIQARIVNRMNNQGKYSFDLKLNERLERQEYNVVLEELKGIESLSNFKFIEKLLKRPMTNEEYNFIYRACRIVNSNYTNQREEFLTFIKSIKIEDKVMRKRKDDLLKSVLNKKSLSKGVSSSLDGVPIELEEEYKNYLNDGYLKIS